jgi:hypothetical protein
MPFIALRIYKGTYGTPKPEGDPSLEEKIAKRAS